MKVTGKCHQSVLELAYFAQWIYENGNTLFMHLSAFFGQFKGVGKFLKNFFVLPFSCSFLKLGM